MKTVHLFSDAYYLISNKAVAKCFMFRDEADCRLFKEKLDHHLKPLCDITAYGFLKDEFQLLVKLKSRKVFEEYFKEKYEGSGNSERPIPETTYIFAQAMANLQSGYAKSFNFKYDRDGGLAKGRYMRQLVESEEELESHIKRINSLQVLAQRSRIWTFRRKEDGFKMELVGNGVVRSSWRCYSEVGEDAELGCFKHKDELLVRGQFDNLPPKSIIFENKRKSLENMLSFMFLKQYSL